MNILIVVATLEEAQPLFNALKITVNKTAYIYKTDFVNHTITLLITGVGMVATAYHMGSINSRDFDIAINIGIAGSFNKNLAIGELVNVTTDCLAELGADYGEKFIPLYHMDFAKNSLDTFIGKNGEFKNNTATENQMINNLKKVRGITVNTINGAQERIKKITTLFSPDTESMEGAAFLFACLKKNLPCFQLRTISNYIEPRNLNNWNIPMAISLLNKRILEIISDFK